MGSKKRTPALVVVALAAWSTACGGGDEPGRRTTPAESLVAVRELRVGSAVDSAGVVVTPSDSFSPRDTVYASVFAEGKVDQAIVTARWTREGDILMGERQQAFPLDGRRPVTFRLFDAGGLPPGEYRVRLRLGADEVGGESFRVLDPADTSNRDRGSDR